MCALPLAPPGKPRVFSCFAVSQSCMTICNPMDHSMSGLPVFNFNVHWAGDAIQPSCPLSCCLQSFPASGSFPMSQLFASGGQSIGASTLASVLPMHIQGWFPLGLTGLIFLQSKGLSRVFPSTTIWKHQIYGFMVHFSHLCMTTEKTIALTIQTFVCKVISLLF